jgi:hypothetical protein
LLVAVFLIYRRRQKRRIEAARKEAPQFVDLDGDDDGDRQQGGGGSRHGRGGISQTYHVSPFTYQSAVPNSPGDPTGEVMEMHNDSTQHLIGTNRGVPGPSSMRTSNNLNSSAAGYPPLATFNHLSPSMSSADYPFRGSESDTLIPPSIGSQAGGNAGNAPNRDSTYVLRTRNNSADSRPPDQAQASALPHKGSLLREEQEREADYQASSRRLLQHADGGPLLRNATSDVEELPPTYGQWSSPLLSAQGHAQSTTSEPLVTSEVTAGASAAAPTQERRDSLW